MAANRTTGWSSWATRCSAVIAASWLFERFAGEPEGLLTLRKAAIVNDAQLAQTARRLEFGSLTQLGSGMRAAGGDDNTTVLADAFEAFVGALYLRYGLEKVRAFVLAEHVERLDHSADGLLDAKTRLQHYSQEHLAATPVYRETSRGTPQHPAFRSRVSVKGKILGTRRRTFEESRAAGRRAGSAAFHRRRDVGRRSEPMKLQRVRVLRFQDIRGTDGARFRRRRHCDRRSERLG